MSEEFDNPIERDNKKTCAIAGVWFGQKITIILDNIADNPEKSITVIQSMDRQNLNYFNNCVGHYITEDLFKAKWQLSNNEKTEAFETLQNMIQRLSK